MSTASVFRRLISRRVLLAAVLLCGLLFTGFYPYRQTPEQPAFYGDISVLGLDLQSANLKELIGGKKTFIFYFLASCPHCRESAPAVVKLAEKYGKQIQFLGVASGRTRLAEVREFQETFKLPFPVYQDAGATFGARNALRAFPGFLFTDGSATPPENYTSYTHDMDTVLEIALVRFLGKNPLPLLQPDHYYGSQVCATCHTEEYISWGLNNHSVAINSLFRTNKVADPKCVGCHVVAYGKPRGYTDFDSTPELANVGCEECHGAAGGHNRKITPAQKLAEAKIPVEQKYGPVCQKCHDAEHTIGFDLKKGLPIISHKQDRNVSEVDWLSRRTALTQGEGEHPLLEFPPGETQGDKACVSCHADIQKGWLASTHSHAMETLKKAGKDQDVSCVRCHGILKDKKRPEAVDAYLPGVQCESCHGAGEAHVKANGGKGNIVALTKSCPVCVIESLCTSCHNREQDPKFELEAALAKVKHDHSAPAD